MLYSLIMKNKNLKFNIYNEQDSYIAICEKENIFTQGKTFEDLKKNILEAVNCHFSDLIYTKKWNPIIDLNYQYQ